MHPLLTQADCVFFDLDGTLVDSAPDLYLALNHSMQAFGLSTVTVEQVRSWIGRGAKVLVTSALKYHYDCIDNDAKLIQPNITPELKQLLSSNSLLLTSIPASKMSKTSFVNELTEPFLAYFLAHYQQNVCLHTVPYEGVIDLLSQLKAQQKNIACITNKPIKAAQALLKSLAMTDFFSLVLGGDSLAEKKPSPLPLQHALSFYGIASKQAVMVGDSKYDILAAKAVHIPSIAVSYGYNHGEPVSQYQPDLLIDTMLALL